MQEGTGQPDWLGTICEFFTNRRKLPQFVNELCSGHVHPESLRFFQLQRHGNNFALAPAQTFPPKLTVMRNQKESEMGNFGDCCLLIRCLLTSCTCGKRRWGGSKESECQERDSIGDVPGAKRNKEIKMGEKPAACCLPWSPTQDQAVCLGQGWPS